MKANKRLYFLSIFVFAFSGLLYSSNLESGAELLRHQGPKKSALSKDKICSQLLRVAYGQENFSPAISKKILARYAAEQHRMSASLMIEWTRFAQEGLKDGEHIVWMREDGLKDINVISKGITFSEKYLLLKDWHLSEILSEHPEWGRLIHRNFKDRTVITSLSVAEFKKTVLSELQKRLELDLASSGATGMGYLRLLMSRVQVESSRYFEGAHLKAMGFDINAWQQQTHLLREKIQNILSKHTDETTQVLSRVFKDKKKSNISFLKEDVEKSLERQGIPQDISRKVSQDILLYLESIQGADLLPPPDVLTAEQLSKVEEWLAKDKKADKNILELVSRRPWTQRHAQFIRNAFLKGSTSIIAIDIRGFGLQSFVIRDTWMRGDPSRKDLPKIYVESTRELNVFFDQLSKDLKEKTGVDIIAHFRSGDDALMALPADLSSEQMNLLHDFLSRDDRIYYSIATKSSPQESLGLLIETARVGVAEHKDLVDRQKTQQ